MLLALRRKLQPKIQCIFERVRKPDQDHRSQILTDISRVLGPMTHVGYALCGDEGWVPLRRSMERSFLNLIEHNP